MSSHFETSHRSAIQIKRIEDAVAENKSVGKFFAARYRHDGNNFGLCHLVLQGGGTLGIAHLGFIRGLELADVRFAGLAGTSAGAIIALLIAAARKDAIEVEVASQLLPILQSMPAAAFMDGPYFARRFVKFALDKRKPNYMDYVLPGIASVRHLLRQYGLNRGHRFEDWLAHTLSKQFGLATQSQLNETLVGVMAKLTSLVVLNSASDLLHITATAMPLGLKIVFPEHACLFDEKYEERSPAIFARASMSVPLFFEPREVDLNAAKWEEYVENLAKMNAYSKDVITRMKSLKALSFIDGGLLSNFPIDAFADVATATAKCRRGRRPRSSVSVIPTIGVALFSSQLPEATAPRGSVKAFANYTGTAINAMRHVRDREGLERAKQIESQTNRQTKVVFVDTGPHNWLNFNLPQDDMQDLFCRGLQACADFLEQLALAPRAPERTRKWVRK